ncbi:hypothetical protein GGR56DRAFT_651052 [Xylariaceae sp. FL0804]|nr:hypothetical protein GGR56DRAFT_651052 [Xylariaceae sp. FL0804]
MRATTLLTALAAAGSSSAVMMKIMDTESIEYEWTVTNWTAGCAMMGCNYDFTITGALNTTMKPARPAFEASCTGRGEGAAYKDCTMTSGDKDASVVAKLLVNPNKTTTGIRQAHIQVSLQYIDLDTDYIRWNYTGDTVTQYNKFLSPLSFDIVPDEVTGVA